MLVANVQPVSVQTYSAGFVERSRQFADSHPQLCEETVTRLFRPEGRCNGHGLHSFNRDVI
jgi:hypothetical protein